VPVNPREALEILERKLREKGYETRRLREEGECVLEVISGGKKVNICLHEERGVLKELRLRYEGVPGMTILRCELAEKYVSCIEELLARL